MDLCNRINVVQLGTRWKLQGKYSCQSLFWRKLPEGLGQTEVMRIDILGYQGKQKTNTLAGPDGIHPRTLKALKYETVSLLTSIFTMSLELSSTLDNWKIANGPFLKTGVSTGDPRNLE